MEIKKSCRSALVHTFEFPPSGGKKKSLPSVPSTPARESPEAPGPLIHEPSSRPHAWSRRSFTIAPPQIRSPQLLPMLALSFPFPCPSARIAQMDSCEPAPSPSLPKQFPCACACMARGGRMHRHSCWKRGGANMAGTRTGAARLEAFLLV